MSFIDVLKEYFGWTSLREPEGWFSPAHLIYVSIMIAVTVCLAVWLGLKYKDKDLKSKTKALKVAAVTPFSIVETIVGGNQILYTVFVMALYFVYLAVYMGVTLLCRRKSGKKTA